MLGLIFLAWEQLGGAGVEVEAVRSTVPARGKRETCAQDCIWAMKYSSHACRSRSAPLPGDSVSVQAALRRAPAQAGPSETSSAKKRGQRKLKGRKNKPAHLASAMLSVLPSPSFLTCSSRTALDGAIPMFRRTAMVRTGLLSPCSSRKPS